MTERTSRQIQLYAVLAVGFLLLIVTSVRILLGSTHRHPPTSRAFAFMIVYQAIGLLCLCLALRYQKRRVTELGFSFVPQVAEIGHAFALFFGALLVGIFSAVVVSPFLYLTLGHAYQRTFDSAVVFGNTITIVTVLFVFLNPFHEELIVRAFLITEMESLYRSTTLAVTVSVGLQTSYHLYQGLPAALLHIPTFLLFAAYYVRTRRIMPVILAHLFLDVTALSVYAHRLH